ncbi:hypothetical protein FB451DRAFT_1414511 [Mycena latifolia]|nr:hypothetical protein FB451DRAFT_1414511 [Mycena latifolia]
MSNATTSPSGPANGTLIFNPVIEFGPMFVGNMFNWLFLGLLTMQVYTYWVKFPKDRIMLKVLVYSVFVLDLFQTAVGTHEAWWNTISNWGSIEAFETGPWTSLMIPLLCGLISAMVQIFYAFRIWKLKKTAVFRFLAGFIVLLAIAQSIGSIAGSAVLFGHLDVEGFIRSHPILTFWLAGSLVTDIVIAGTMIWILYTAKSAIDTPRTRSLLNRLMVNTIQTGTATAVCAGIELILWVKFTDTNYHIAFGYVLAKLYSNSFMATLNARQSDMHPPEQFESFGMRIQVSRQTDMIGGGTKLQTTSDFNADDVLKA